MEKKSVKGTQTEHNLLAAFAGESMARNRYTYYSEVAKQEGYEQIAGFFLETADNEKEHARRFFSFLEGDHLDVTAGYPVRFGNTVENLEAAAMGEHEEWEVLYPNFARIAEEEGFKNIANTFRAIVEVEKRHEKRYLKLLDNVKNAKVFSTEEMHEWKCRNCGYIHQGTSAVKVCPSCLYPQSYFELHCENY